MGGHTYHCDLCMDVTEQESIDGGELFYRDETRQQGIDKAKCVK